MIDLLDHTTRQAVDIDSENPERTESQMADGRVGDQLFPITLRETNQCSINDCDQGQNAHGVHDRSVRRRLGKQR